MAETLLHGIIPVTADLCCIVAQIDLTETRDSSAKSHFHWKTMKCRLIIHTMQNAVIASPIYEGFRSIYVITSIELFNSDILQSTLRAMNITWSAPQPVTPSVYGNCLRYAIQFAIAPRWNRVGQYMLNEQYFLTLSESNFATRFNLAVQTRYDKKLEASIKLAPTKIRMCPITLEGLHLPREVIAHFMADPKGVIDIGSYCPTKVTVLPSLKKGWLTKVFKNIPATSPFKNYGELRRHWKNMYGYRLPKSDGDIMYCDIYFPLLKDEHFLYPDICVRTQVSEIPYLGNREEIVREFLRDVNETMPVVCGRPFLINEKKENIMDSSIEENATSISYQSPKTPEISRNVFRNDEDRTTRFSLSCQTPQNRLCRDTSTLMSPTPSLRGNLRSNETKDSNSRSVLTRITQIHETKQELSDIVRPKEDLPANFEYSKKLKIEEGRSLSMETGVPLSSILMPCSTSACPQNDVEQRRLLTPIVNLPQEPLTSGRPEKVEKRKIISDERISKYFKPRHTSQENTESQALMEMTMSQKLLRNRNFV